jgi:hypothetical protein
MSSVVDHPGAGGVVPCAHWVIHDRSRSNPRASRCRMRSSPARRPTAGPARNGTAGGCSGRTRATGTQLEVRPGLGRSPGCWAERRQRDACPSRPARVSVEVGSREQAPRSARPSTTAAVSMPLPAALGGGSPSRVSRETSEAVSARAAHKPVINVRVVRRVLSRFPGVDRRAISTPVTLDDTDVDRRRCTRILRQLGAGAGNNGQR